MNKQEKDYALEGFVLAFVREYIEENTESHTTIREIMQAAEAKVQQTRWLNGWSGNVESNFKGWLEASVRKAFRTVEDELENNAQWVLLVESRLRLPLDSTQKVAILQRCDDRGDAMRRAYNYTAPDSNFPTRAARSAPFHTPLVIVAQWVPGADHYQHHCIYYLGQRFSPGANA